MTLSELLGSFGDKSTDPFLAEPASAFGMEPPDDDSFGSDPPPALLHNHEPTQVTVGEMPEANQPLGALSMDSVFSDGAPAEPFQTDAAGLTGLPARPAPGVQFSTIVGREHVGELNDSLRRGWRISHAVPLGCSVDVMLVLEYGARRPDVEAPFQDDSRPGDSSLPVPIGRPQPPAWVATPSNRPSRPADWKFGD